VYLALDTSMLWNTYCLVRISIVYRGRAVPLVWKLLEHPAAVWPMKVYQEMLEQVVELLPCDCSVVLPPIVGAPTRISWHI